MPSLRLADAGGSAGAGGPVCRRHALFDNTTTERFHQCLVLLSDDPASITYLEFRADYHVELRGAEPRRLRRMIPDHVSSLVRPYGLAQRADEWRPDPPKING